MSTDVTFDAMLKKYMPYQLLTEELMKRDYFLGRVDKDQMWRGGEMQIPFNGGKASSIAYGELTAIADIVEDRDILGTVSGYKEIWGSMLFNHRDLDQHDNMEQSFIKILPNKLESFIESMKEAVSVNLLNGRHFLTLNVAAPLTNLVAGIVVVDRPARCEVGQYIEFADAAGVLRVAGYVKQIVIDDKTIEIVALKDLSGASTNLGVAGVIAGDLGYIRGARTAGNAFTSLRDQLLSLANGGSANQFGVAKLTYPHLQAANFDGSAITAVNILTTIFDKYNETRTLGKGNPTEAIMSYKNLAAAMSELEKAGSPAAQGRQFVAGDRKASAFGWTEIEVMGVKGQLKLIGVQEMDDDIIHVIDWGAMKLHSNGMFERRESPEGKQYFESRAASGYTYVVDTRFYGELVVSKPSHCGIIHSVSF